ncbi:MAG: B12-binding domain-containing radical SAM protein [Planctomycetota bacterium]|jgi:anaerobic magnesium-protoporphyrin IX monomethyl ester cyclase
MKVLLLNPSSRGTFRLLGFLLPPLGLLYVAAAVRRRGHPVRVVDRSVDRRPLDFGDVDVVGIHTDTTRVDRALRLAAQAKASGAKVVMGGPHPCFVAEEVFTSGFVDAVVRGEGEESFPDLLDAWEKGGDLAGIPGLLLPGPQGPRDTGPRSPIFDVDGLPFPARDLIDLSLYDRARMHNQAITPLHTSRGCPNGCRFCSSTQFDGPRWRARSASSVLEELQHLHQDLGFRAVAFMDDNFTRSPERIHRLCEGILERKLNLHWWCFSRVDTVVRHPDMIRHMAEAGARSIFIGVESQSTTTLHRFGKGIGPQTAREAVRILKANGFEVLASYILGAKEESRRDLRATIRFACELDTDTAQFTLLTPYPGTALYEELKGRIRERDWRKYDSMHAVFEHPRIPRWELQIWLGRAYTSFYLRHRRSVARFFRFLSKRKFGLQALGQALSRRRF